MTTASSTGSAAASRASKRRCALPDAVGATSQLAEKTSAVFSWQIR